MLLNGLNAPDQMQSSRWCPSCLRSGGASVLARCPSIDGAWDRAAANTLRPITCVFSQVHPVRARMAGDRTEHHRGAMLHQVGDALWDKPASTPAMIAARAWAQASDDTPQSASKQHHRYTTWRAAHETVGFRQRCPFSGCRVQSSPTTSSSADMHPVVTHAAPSPSWRIRSEREVSAEPLLAALLTAARTPHARPAPASSSLSALSAPATSRRPTPPVPRASGSRARMVATRKNRDTRTAARGAATR